MSTKRQPAKQRRQTQNQKQRAALEARRQAAAASQAPAGRGGGGSGSAVPVAKGSVLSRLRGASTTGRAVRTGGTGALPVGHRAALSAVFAAVAAAVVGSILFRMPIDRNGDVITTRGALVAEWTLSARDAASDDPEATPAEVAASIDDWTPGGDKPYIQAYWPVSLAVVLPVIGTGLGFRAVSKRSSAKLVNRTMYLTLFGTLLAAQLLLIFLPAVISLAVAAFQVRKAEVAAARAAPATADPDEVIDVDEVVEVEALDAVDAVDAVDEGEAVDEVDEERR